MAEQLSIGRRAPASSAGLPVGGMNTMPPGMEAPNVRDWLAMVRRHLRLAAGVTAAVVVMAGYLAYTSPEVYRAKSVVRLVDARRALAGGLVDASAIGDIALASANPVLSQVEVLRSRGTAGAVVDDMPILRIRTRHFPATFVKNVRLASSVGMDSVQLRFGQHTVTVEGQGQSSEAAYGAPIEVRGIGFTIAEAASHETGTLYIVP